MALSDRNHPQIIPIITFWVFLHISVTGEARIFKFKTYVGHDKCSPWDDKPPQMGVVRMTWPILKFWNSKHNFGTGQARHFKFDIQIHHGDS